MQCEEKREIKKVAKKVDKELMYHKLDNKEHFYLYEAHNSDVVVSPSIRDVDKIVSFLTSQKIKARVGAINVMQRYQIGLSFGFAEQTDLAVRTVKFIVYSLNGKVRYTEKPQRATTRRSRSMASIPQPQRIMSATTPNGRQITLTIHTSERYSQGYVNCPICERVISAYARLQHLKEHFVRVHDIPPHIAYPSVRYRRGIGTINVDIFADTNTHSDLPPPPRETTSPRNPRDGRYARDEDGNRTNIEIISVDGRTAWNVPSRSTPGRFYTVKYHNGSLSCDCRAWIYNQRGDRTCPHTERVTHELGHSYIDPERR